MAHQKSKDVVLVDMENFGGMLWRFLSPCVYTEPISSFKQRVFVVFGLASYFVIISHLHKIFK